MPDAPDAESWGTCLYCGDAVPPGIGQCPICGAIEPLRPAEEKTASKSSRRRFQALRALRASIVVVAILGVCYLVVSPVFSGPPMITDPLTTSGSYVMGPANTTVLAGEITGADYLIGNLTVQTPSGSGVTLVVYDSAQYQAYRNGTQTDNQSWWASGGSYRFIFPAPTTDTYYFVFTNPYPVGSGLVQTVYIATTYTPNVQSFS